MMKRTISAAPAGALAGLLLLAGSLPSPAQEREFLPTPHPDLPQEFKQLIPRGQIVSVDDPQFVPADEAEILDDAWVLGVAIDGQARAYSLNLLNEHEVVNDRIGERSFAAVW
jgi:hypothetical protein